MMPGMIGERFEAPEEKSLMCGREWQGRRGRAGLRWLLRLLVTGLLLFLLSRRVPWREFWPAWQALSPRALLLAVALTVLSMAVSAYKWRLLLVEPGLGTPGTARLLQIYLIGLFFNNFLPSGMGGDVVRIALAARAVGTARAAASVIAERLLAAIGLILPALVFYWPHRHELGPAALVIPLLALAIAMVAGAAFFPGWAGRLAGLFRGRSRASRGLNQMVDIMGRYSSNPGRLLQVILWSVVFQGIVILINYVLFRGMGIPVKLVTCMLVVPLISALAMVPFSINGLGLREWSYITLFAPFGVGAAPSLAVSLIFFLVVMAVSLAGGVLYVLEK
ncbi:MAG: glycosyltransferase 2 family protein [Moorella sp. (in: firmicutes)]|nr:glycosyltransferase 2 family protein [Moorella sp. (in: firmicutes)]